MNILPTTKNGLNILRALHALSHNGYGRYIHMLLTDSDPQILALPIEKNPILLDIFDGEKEIPRHKIKIFTQHVNQKTDRLKMYFVGHDIWDFLKKEAYIKVVDQREFRVIRYDEETYGNLVLRIYVFELHPSMVEVIHDNFQKQVSSINYLWNVFKQEYRELQPEEFEWEYIYQLRNQQEYNDIDEIALAAL